MAKPPVPFVSSHSIRELLAKSVHTSRDTAMGAISPRARGDARTPTLSLRPSVDLPSSNVISSPSTVTRPHAVGRVGYDYRHHRFRETVRGEGRRGDAPERARGRPIMSENRHQPLNGQRALVTGA